jgi:hypothetical protein
MHSRSRAAWASSRADCSCWSRASACWRALCSCWSCPSAMASTAALSARSALSCSACWLSPQPGSPRTTTPRGSCGPAEAGLGWKRAPSRTPPLQPAPSAVPRPAPEVSSSPSQPRMHLPQPGRPDPGTRPAELAAGTTTSHCRSAGLPRGRRGCRTGPGTSHAWSSIGRGGHTSPELGAPTPVTGRQGARGSKVRRRANTEGIREKLQIQ